MTDDKELNEKDLKDFNNVCEECKKDEESSHFHLSLTKLVFDDATLINLFQCG